MTRRMMLGCLSGLVLLVPAGAQRVDAQAVLPPLPGIEGLPPDLQKELERMLDPSVFQQMQQMQALQLQAMQQQMQALQDLQLRQRGAIFGQGTKWGGAQLVKVDGPLQEKLGLPENEGMVATAIDPNSPAATAGLKVNDVLVKINNKPVPADDLNSLTKLVQEQNVADGVDLVVIRDGKEETIKGSKMPASLQVGGMRGIAGIGGRGGVGGRGGIGGAAGGIRINPILRNPNPLPPPQGKIDNLQLEMSVNGARISRKQSTDQFSGAYTKDELKINVAGKIENGVARLGEIVVQDGKNTKKYASLGEVPAQQQVLIQQYLLPSGTSSIRIQMPVFPNPGIQGLQGFPGLPGLNGLP